ncbi:MAG: dodecin family protein [Cyclobacteriaceae bacterium]|nr:dodecin family protein [Cyclobacteriaceae bacterium]
MSVHKVIEVLAYSDKSWEDAAQQAVSDASKSLKNIESIYIKDHSGKVENNQIAQYRINASITFKVE